MISDFKSFSLMGIPNSEMYFFEKDPNSMEFNLVVTPTLEVEDSDQIFVQKQVKVEEEEEKCKFLVSTLEIKSLPASIQEFNKKEDDHHHVNGSNCDDGFKTPTSKHQRIPVILPCPPAPRKPKSLPSINRKRLFHKKILLDLCNEVESLFPPALRADLGSKIKNVKTIIGQTTKGS